MEEDGHVTEGNTDSDDPDAIIGDYFLFFGMIDKVLQFALFREVVDTSTALANGWEGTQVLDHLLS